jgi:predicted CXXCH cytochrome family protein
MTGHPSGSPWRLSLLVLAFASLGPRAIAQDAIPDPLAAALPQEMSEVEKIAREMLALQNATCLGCHVGDSVHAEESPLLFSVPAADDAIRMSPAFAASNHGDLACTTCHVGAFKAYPHVAEPARMSAMTLECSECHAQKTHSIDLQISKSVHAENFGDRFTCITCHDPHVMLSGPKATDPLKLVAQDNAACLSCHTSDETFAAIAGDISPGITRPDIDSIHTFLPNTQRHWQAVRCVDCHTPMISEGASLGISHQIVGKEDAVKDCATCHTLDTVLRTTLYRHAKEGAARGFENASIVESAYVIGATRNTTLDRLGIVVTLLALAGVLGHGLLRWIAASTRKGR